MLTAILSLRRMLEELTMYVAVACVHGRREDRGLYGQLFQDLGGTVQTIVHGDDEAQFTDLDLLHFIICCIYSLLLRALCNRRNSNGIKMCGNTPLLLLQLLDTGHYLIFFSRLLTEI